MIAPAGSAIDAPDRQSIFVDKISAQRLTGIAHRKTYDLVVVANRLPVDRATTLDGESSWQPSPGGLVAALQPVVATYKGAWVGWGGDTTELPPTLTVDGMDLLPIALSDEEVHTYYEGQSNATIWPLYHDCIQPPEFHRAWREGYRKVNQRFAEAAARTAAQGATVWVHDYQLQLVPGMLRELRPDVRIGFFLHIPFPPTELFLQMPLRTEIIKGLLGSDLIGFQHPEGARNFLRLAHRLLGLHSIGDRIPVGDRWVKAAAFPISIDVAEIDRIAADPAVQAQACGLRRELGDPDTVLLGVDRLDYTKGIEHRLKAFEELLREGRLSPSRTLLVQVAVPSRERVGHYQALQGRVNRMIGRINGDFSTVGRPAVHYLHRSLPRRDLVALYLAADVMLVTPLRDGMNLVAKEYVATRRTDTGALVLSEFAGAATELTQAHLVNPHDIDALKDTMVAAIDTTPHAAARRIRLMRSHLRHHDVHAWAQGFLDVLCNPSSA